MVLPLPLSASDRDRVRPLNRCFAASALLPTCRPVSLGREVNPSAAHHTVDVDHLCLTRGAQAGSVKFSNKKFVFSE